MVTGRSPLCAMVDPGDTSWSATQSRFGSRLNHKGTRAARCWSERFPFGPICHGLELASTHRRLCLASFWAT